MPIALSCPCGRALNVKDEFAGRKIRCPDCKSTLTVLAAQKEIDPDDLALEVLRADEPEDNPPREAQRAAIQSDPPQAWPARPRRWDDEEGNSPVRRRSEEDRPSKRRPKPPPDVSRRAPRVAFEQGWFGSTNSGVAGGLLMLLIAVVWLVVGLAFGRLFFYPIILVVIGIVAIGKGLMGGGD